MLLYIYIHGLFICPFLKLSCLYLLSQLNQAETRCIELEDASSKALSEITSLNEEMEGLKSKEGVVEELQQQLQDVEVQLDLKQTEVRSCIGL